MRLLDAAQLPTKTQRRKDGVIGLSLRLGAHRGKLSDELGGLYLMLATSHFLHRYRDDRFVSRGPVVRHPVARLGIPV